MGKAFIDRTGERYGNLVVLEFLGKPPGKTKAVWDCICDCGTKAKVTSSNLATGHTQSCGCLQVKVMEDRRIYAKEDTQEYVIWRGIKQRTGKCPGKNAKWYSDIHMHPDWFDSFDTFLQDMGKRPTPNHSIERLDGTKGYVPGNCVWVTPVDQANNRSTNRLLSFGGEELTVAQWARRTGIKQFTICARIDKLGWSVEDALTTPINKRKP